MAEPRPLTTEEVAPLLRATGGAITAELAGVSADVAAWHPGPGEWYAKEYLGHIMEAEVRGFGGRIRQILANVQAYVWPSMGNAQRFSEPH